MLTAREIRVVEDTLRELLDRQQRGEAISMLCHEVLMHPSASLGQKKVAMRAMRVALGGAIVEAELAGDIHEYVSTFGG